ncbi:hypothetical protein VTO42DRAFT_7728 [Malbranchea cinnamomea]
MDREESGSAMIREISSYLGPGEVKARLGPHPWVLSMRLLPHLSRLKSIRLDDNWLRLGLAAKRSPNRLDLATCFAAVPQQGALERLEVGGPYKECVHNDPVGDPKFNKFIGHCLASPNLKFLTIPVPARFSAKDIPHDSCRLPAMVGLKLHWIDRNVWQSLEPILQQAANLKRLAILGSHNYQLRMPAIRLDLARRALENVKDTLNGLVFRLSYDETLFDLLTIDGVTQLALREFEMIRTLEIPGTLLQAWRTQWQF